ncbi:hypothetical protein GUITHDRAFT_143790 [Guillardia theta CCMP2712]|uniref:Sugar phosphate transporter domain-containing protein n=1 Tax=Guillardia theta (strain CCMP2712) TaxID=905079 RepID=L1IT10_GUITC|nr:hypothetical protein GUITHDRAFT_143790 [Guillardia theta CCMP2712]EKX38975.1 hypothetical protein GUITHDRAFT_143790 [Guillardia theta CCMP2712]|mmetsp:Transcript_16322/g.54661  ORF Transcript_16322/g.54661 Transcript_16322/m.54661 type:complete len:341 (-) Transcript_16322:169-1191(-)|eukprot:XP_005825955.1 hypothetical protein GUITHDRAFT_143790 [Guillardia theta CCMP2712]
MANRRNEAKAPPGEERMRKERDVGGHSKEEHLVQWKKIIPCICYALSSIYMTLAQKYVVINASEVKALFLFYQNAAALLMFLPTSLGLLQRFHILPYTFWDTRAAFSVLPLGITYSIMLYSSNWALSLLTVPMVSVLKNIGPVVITLFESWTEGKEVSISVFLSLLMLVSGGLVAAYNDLMFDGWGYLLMFFNVLTNVVHVNLTKRMRSLSIRKEVVLHYQSIFMCIFLLPELMNQDLNVIVNGLRDQPLVVQMAFFSTGVNGIVIALCTMWCIEATSGSTYSMVGALNKIPSSILGIFIFRNPVSVLNLVGVGIGLIGGVVFSLDKQISARINRWRKLE